MLLEVSDYTRDRKVLLNPSQVVMVEPELQFSEDSEGIKIVGYAITTSVGYETLIVVSEEDKDRIVSELGGIKS
jgi:hypothetical protein